MPRSGSDWPGSTRNDHFWEDAPLQAYRLTGVFSAVLPPFRSRHLSARPTYEVLPPLPSPVRRSTWPSQVQVMSWVSPLPSEVTCLVSPVSS